MRYSIIHHDVRERFGLNLNQYAVADSIHQLSQRGPTTKPNTKIAEFLGLDETTVRRSKTTLIEKGLIEEVDEGFRTTELWYETVTYARQKADPSAKSREVREIAETYNISKEIKNSGEPQIVIVSETEERPKKARDPFEEDYHGMCDWAAKRRGAKFVSLGKQFAALKKAREHDIGPGRLKKRWIELESQDFYAENGLDWAMVVSSFDRKV